MRRKPPRPFVSSGAYSSELVVNGASVGATRDDAGWFLARVAGAVTGGFTFVEQWVDASGAVADKSEGRANSAADPAVTVNGATPATGDKVLIRRAPGGAGGWWELVPIGGGGTSPALVTGTATLSATVTSFGAAGVWGNSGFSITLPSAGTYLVTANAAGYIQCATAPTFNAHTLEARLQVGGLTPTGIVCSASVAGQYSFGSTEIGWMFTVAGSTVVPLQIRYTLGAGAGTGTVGVVGLIGSLASFEPRTTLRYQKLA